MDAKLAPNEAEMKALREFVCRDETRENLATLWEYESPEGCTHVATDGHTLAMRRAGTHVDMPIADIEKLLAIPLDKRDISLVAPHWAYVVTVPKLAGKNVAARGINPAYFARVALVEKAAGKRAALDYVPPPGYSQKDIRRNRSNLQEGACSIWAIGTDPLAAWHWHIPGKIRWEGVIMPRRV